MRLQKEIQSLNCSNLTQKYGFFDFSLNFYSAPLCSKYLGQLIKDNTEVLENILPGYTAVLGEVFQYEGKGNSELHTAGSTVTNCAMIIKYIDAMNVHLTLTGMSSKETNPFLVWENSDESIASSRYIYNYLLKRGVVNQSNKELFLQAVEMSERPNKTDHDHGCKFLYRNFWREYYCNDIKREINGVYGLYEKGHAFVFAPNKPHGGEVLSQSIEESKGRTSVGFRLIRVNESRFIFDQIKSVLNPFHWKTFAEMHKVRRRYQGFGQVTVDFYAKLFGYENTKELIDTLYGGVRPLNYHGIPISFRKQTRLDKRRGYVSFKALERHYDKCHKFFENYELNDNCRKFVADYYAGTKN
jgi:hypothetical protein